MAEESGGSNSTSLLSPNALMAIATVVGGLLLVSHKLSSERPGKPAIAGTRPLGIQNIESRLWEDPFSAWGKLTDDDIKQRTAEGLAPLVEVLTNSVETNGPTKLLVLGVMVSGQPYAEDTESRIRARYAVGAALGSAGYKPDTADHIGLAARTWPSSRELEQWKRDTNAELRIAPDEGPPSPHCFVANTNFHLRVPFEQYLRREYFPRREFVPPGQPLADAPRYDRILLLWLDEEYFDDDPAARLALFKQDLSSSVTDSSTSNIEWSIIGPRSSTTLRDLLGSIGNLRSHTNLWTAISNELKSIRLTLATPSAMDELVVEDRSELRPEDFKFPRAAVAKVLGNAGLFQSVNNFSCTDKEFAKEAVRELEYRGIFAANTNQHIVLVSEWDTFFSRVAGLAFAQQMTLAARYPSPTNTSLIETDSFSYIIQAKGGTNYWPPNLHRFAYLQGLDGEAAEGEDAKKRRDEKDNSQKERPATLEEIAKWTPDANKAEGAAQFDYLGRLADYFRQLDDHLASGHGGPAGGHIVAVGIIGSDVYDTLLILQALRDRLPDAVFFTSDLDARFWGPNELQWTRNLVVLSGYGLRLNDYLQAGMPPFRESAQCAEFLATLSAIGNEKVANLDRTPRHFEIGRHGPVDLSLETGEEVVEPGLIKRFWHEIKNPVKMGFHWFARLLRSWGRVLIACAAIILVLLISKLFRGARWSPFRFATNPLRFQQKQIGSDCKLENMLQKLQGKWPNDSFAEWLCKTTAHKDLQSAQPTTLLDKLVFMGADERDAQRPGFTNSECEELGHALTSTDIFTEESRRNLLKSLQNIHSWKGWNFSVSDAKKNHRAIGELLEKLIQPTQSPGAEAYIERRRARKSCTRRTRLLRLLVALAIVGSAVALTFTRSAPSQNAPPQNLAALHPSELSQQSISAHPSARQVPHLSGLAITIASLALLTFVFAGSKFVRQLVLPSLEYSTQPLRVSEEDIGGVGGFETILKRHAKWNDDPLARWLFDGMQIPESKHFKLIHKDSRNLAGKRLVGPFLKRCNEFVFMKPDQSGLEAERSGQFQQVRENLHNAAAQTQMLTEESRRNLLNSIRLRSKNRILNAIKKRFHGRTHAVNNYEALSELLEKFLVPRTPTGRAAYAARQCARLSCNKRRWRALLFWLAAGFVAIGLAKGISLAWQDTFWNPGGEPFNFHGTSAWPTQFIRFGVLAFNIIIIVAMQRRLSQTRLSSTRQYRLNLEVEGIRNCRWTLPTEPQTEVDVNADAIWNEYGRTRFWLPRFCRVALAVLIYFVFMLSLAHTATWPLSPLRGDVLLRLDRPLLLLTIVSFVFMTFWIIDSSILCARFINHLSKAPTHYPEPTLNYFKAQRSLTDKALVEEWIDLQLISDLTESIGRLVYWPFVSLFLILFARNPWWDNWTWPWLLTVVFVINLGLASVSYLILQRAALRAQDRSIKSLKTKVNEKLRKAAPSEAEHESSQAEKLLEEISNLRRGAFAPISQNPLLGALLLNSSGVVLIELLAQHYFK